MTRELLRLKMRNFQVKLSVKAGAYPTLWAYKVNLIDELVQRNICKLDRNGTETGINYHDLFS